MSGSLLIPNIGAEESLGLEAGARENAPPDLYAQAAEFADVADPVLQTAALWRLLFGAEAKFATAREAAVEFWPADFGKRTRDPVFDWLDTPAAAWLNTTEAAVIAKQRGHTLLGAPPEIVELVHDKAFSHRMAAAEGFLPASLDPLVEVLEPAALRNAAGARSWIVDSVNRWPAWTERRFTLKPRFGTSGRGRVAGIGERIAAGDSGFGRLAACGGAMLEPWLRRATDLSAQMWIEPDGQIVLLGTTELIVEPSGLYRGHRGTIDSRGRVHCASRYDEALREAAAAVARAAFAAGYWGPCGLDAFAFHLDGREVFRPIVEFNARFTLGTLVVGLLRRALPRIREALSLDPGGLRSFYFGLSGPEAGWSQPDRGLLVPLAAADASSEELRAAPSGRASRQISSRRQTSAEVPPYSGPGLVLAMDRDELDKHLASRSDDQE
jgi:hypothetical protein